MKLGIKKYMSIFVCAAFLLSIVNIDIEDNTIKIKSNSVKAAPTDIRLAANLDLTNKLFFEDIGTDTYKNGLLWDTDSDDWDPWMNPTGTEDDGAMQGAEALTGVKVYLDNKLSTDIAGLITSTWAGKHYLTFVKDGYVTKTRNITINAPATVDSNATALERADAVIGRITDPYGTPIVGAWVIAYPTGTSSFANPPAGAVTDEFGHTIEAFSDKFGNYILKGLKKGNYVIKVFGPEAYNKDGYFFTHKNLNGVNTDLGPKTLNIQADYLVYGRIFGQVLYTGSPLVGATVEIPGLGISTTTDANGEYDIDNVPPGMYTIIVKKQGYETAVLYYDSRYGWNDGSAGHPPHNPICNEATVSNLSYTPPETPYHYAPYIGPGSNITIDWSLMADQGGCYCDIKGTVNNGAPIEYTTVEIPAIGRTITTDKTGYYIFREVPCGHWWVVASDPEPDAEGRLDHKTKKEMIDCTGSEPAIEFNFTLEENYSYVFGRVLDYDTDWIPVPGATVEIPNAGISTTADDWGYFVIENLPVKRWSWWSDTEGFAYKTQEYLLKVTKNNYFSTTEYIKPIPSKRVWQELHIKKKTQTLKGIVYEWDTDQPIEDILVTACGREAFTNSNGLYEFVNVPVDTYTVFAYDEGGVRSWPYGTDYYEPKVKTDIEVSVSGITICDFWLPDYKPDHFEKITGSVSGYIWYDWNGSFGFNNEGEGVSGASVEISGKEVAVTDDYGYYVSKKSTPDAKGQYDANVVRTGDHFIVVKANTYEIKKDTFTVPLVNRNVSKDMELLKLVGEVKGTVYDEELERPVDNELVEIPLAGAPPGYVALADNNPIDYTNGWGSSITDTLGVYFINEHKMNDSGGNPNQVRHGVPVGFHLIRVLSPENVRYGGNTYVNAFYEEKFDTVTVSSLINKNLGVKRRIGRVEGFVYRDVNGNTTPESNELYYESLVKLSGKSVDPRSNDDNHSSITDTGGYYTILNIRVTEDEGINDAPQIIWHRYTATGEYSGYNKEKWYHDTAINSPEYDYSNNVMAVWACDRISETTLQDDTVGIGIPAINNLVNFLLDKKTSTDGYVSGDVDLEVNLYDSNAVVWREPGDNYIIGEDYVEFWSVTDIEGYYLMPNVAPGVPPGNYGLDCTAYWYEVKYGRPTLYQMDVKPLTVNQNSESVVDFDLYRKHGAFDGAVLEEDFGIVEAAPHPVKGATVTVGNPNSGFADAFFFPVWQITTGDYDTANSINYISPNTVCTTETPQPEDRYWVYIEKDGTFSNKYSGLLDISSVVHMGGIVLMRHKGFIDGYVWYCVTYKPIEDVDVDATKERSIQVGGTNTLIHYKFTEQTDREGYYIIEGSITDPKIYYNETNYTATVDGSSKGYVDHSIADIIVTYNTINNSNDFVICRNNANRGTIKGIVYVDTNSDDDPNIDPGNPCGGEILPDIKVEIPGLGLEVTSTSCVYDPLGEPYNFLFTNVPIPENESGDAEYWVKFTDQDLDGDGVYYEIGAAMFVVDIYNGSNYNGNPFSPSGNWIEGCAKDPINGILEGFIFWDQNDDKNLGTTEEKLTYDLDYAAAIIPGSLMGWYPADDSGYYMIDGVPPYMPVGSTNPAVYTLEGAALGYYPYFHKNKIMAPRSQPSPWSMRFDFPLELNTDPEYGWLHGVVFFDGLITSGDSPDDTDTWELQPYLGASAVFPDDYDTIGWKETTETEGIKGANVSLEGTTWSTTTDSFGYYVIEDIGCEKRYNIHVSATNFQDYDVNSNLIDSGWNSLSYQMSADTGSISGRVYWDFNQNGHYDLGEEIEDASVSAFVSGEGGFAASTYTSADGTYFLPLVPVIIGPGTYTVHAQAPPRHEDNTAVGITVSPGIVTEDVDIILMRKHGCVQGEVTYDGTSYLYGAEVNFHFHWITYEKIFTVYIDETGQYSFSTEDINGNNILDTGEDKLGGRSGMLDELWFGQWTIEVKHPAFQTKTVDIEVSVESPCYIYDFDFLTPGDLLPNTAKITGEVKPSVSGAHIIADGGTIVVETFSNPGGGYDMWVPHGFYNTITCEAATYPTITAGPYNIMDYGLSPPAGFSDLDLDSEVDDLTLHFDYSGVVMLSSPPNLATLTSLNVPFTWNPFGSATTYTIHVDDTPDCSSPIYTNSISAPTTTDSHTFSTYATYYWRVTADNSGWSAIWSFTISATGVGPELVYPENGTTITDQTPTFDWDTFTGATNYTIWVDDTPDFSSKVINQIVSAPTTGYTPGSDLADDTGYWWKVKADNSGWSDTWYFYVDKDAGSVSGTVTTGGTTPLGDVIIMAYIIEDWGRIEKVGETTSDVNGIFSLSPLPSGVAMDIAFYKQSYKADSLHITLSASQVLTGQTMNLEAGTTYTLQLKIGWNLISLPLIIDEDTPIPAIFYPIEGKYTRIHLWDASSGYYVNYRVTPDFTHQNEFKYLKMDVGYWVYATEDTNFVLSGLQNTSARNVHLYHGWNMMGYAFNTSKTISTAVTANYNKINLMWRWNAVTDTYELFDPWGRFTNQFTTFTPGYGYWVYADEDTTITIQ